jgi:hypothetical protein
MPYADMSDRDYKKDYIAQKKRGKKELAARNERERARDLYDKRGIDRKGKDIDHKVPLSAGGATTKGNLRLQTPEANRSFARNSDHTVKVRKTK